MSRAALTEAQMREVVTSFIEEEGLLEPGVDLDPEAQLVDLLDSIALLNLVGFLEDEFEIQVPDPDISRENLSTVVTVCRYVRTRIESG